MSLEGHAAAIRGDMARMEKDPVASRRYATVAARWGQIRLRRQRGLSTPGDDARFTELTNVTPPIEHRATNDEYEPTRARRRPGDGARLLCQCARNGDAGADHGSPDCDRT